jgi:flagellar biosynthesis protein FliR
VAVHAVATGFSLALQLASPFVVIGIAWHLAMGLISRIISRMQIYFVSIPGQIILGLALLTVTVSAMTVAWHDGAEAFLGALPGGG